MQQAEEHREQSEESEKVCKTKRGEGPTSSSRRMHCSLTLLLLLYYSRPRVECYNKYTSLQYEPSSELLLITAKQLFLNRVLPDFY